jgi:hypothetical protein
MSAQHVLAEWNAARHWLAPALEDIEEGDLINEMFLNRAQLWRGERSAMVTQLVGAEVPNVTVWLGGGDLDDLLALQPGVEAWARQQGCREARINGRPGWARALRATGFEEYDGELRKVL